MLFYCNLLFRRRKASEGVDYFMPGYFFTFKSFLDPKKYGEKERKCDFKLVIMPAFHSLSLSLFEKYGQILSSG